MNRGAGPIERTELARAPTIFLTIAVAVAEPDGATPDDLLDSAGVTPMIHTVVIPALCQP